MTQPGLIPHLAVEPRGAAFARARFLSDRKAFGRFLCEHQVDPTDQGAKEEARRAFEQLAPLRDPDVRSLSVEALTQARGVPVVSTAWTAWTTVHRPTGGWRQEASWSSYCSWHGEQATQVHIRGEGVVFAPVVTTDGYRKNSSVATVHQLILDCDGLGQWGTLLEGLDRLGLAFLTHQTGGWTPTMPKWRVILPLDRAFPIASQSDVERWKAAYTTARTALGSIAWLAGVGFDPATDAPSHPWFPGFTRDASAPTRRGHYRGGLTLDIDKLVAALPQVEVITHAVDDALDLDSPSLLVLAFGQAGMLGREIGQGRYSVFCPWNSSHSQPLAPDADPTSATVLFPPNNAGNVGALFCAHSSCGSKTLDEVLDALPVDAVQRARAMHVAYDQDLRGGDMAPDISGRLPTLPGGFR